MTTTKSTKSTKANLQYKLYGVGPRPANRKPLTTRQRRQRLNKILYGV